MARKPPPSFEMLWARHESIYRKVFSEAMKQLMCLGNIKGNEDGISQELAPFLVKVCFELNKAKGFEIRPPVWEGPIHENKKRPDFTCFFVNSMATSSRYFQLSFHVECKRLGYPTSATWVLNKKYVQNGIYRFDSPTHQYGKDVVSGMMIGYIISMEPTQIQNEVNAFQENLLPASPKLGFDFQCEAPFQTEQQLKRTSVKPESFRLIHLWIDLRGNYKT